VNKVRTSCCSRLNLAQCMHTPQTPKLVLPSLIESPSSPLPALPTPRLLRSSRTTLFLLGCASIAPHPRAIRLTNLLVSGARIQRIILAACLALRRRLGLLGARLVGIEGRVRVPSSDPDLEYSVDRGTSESLSCASFWARNGRVVLRKRGVRVDGRARRWKVRVG
jgi:hypothetical protein